MSSRGSPPCAIKSFLKLPHPFSLPPFFLSLSCSLLDFSKSAWRVSMDGINIFPGKNVGSAPERTRGEGGRVAQRVIFCWRVSLTSILSISTFSRVSYRPAVSFSIYPWNLLLHFSFLPPRFRGSGVEWTRANTTDKTKVCIAAGSLA